MKQLFNFKDMVNKTIKKSCSGYSENELWIRFTDDTFIIIRAINRSEGFGQSYEVIEVDEYPADNTEQSLVDLGFITAKEHDYAIEERDKKYELERQQREKEQEEENKQRELLLLKKLKDKYEG